MMLTSATLFTGGGGFEQGAMMAGYTPVWGVEIRPDIATWAERNTPGLKVIVSDVAAVDYASLPKVDHLHASPSCKKASVANADGGECEEDIAAALAVVNALWILQPESFTLENVWGYREFESFKKIVQCLTEIGYFVDWWHLNSADYAIPQTRKRLILITRKDRQPTRPQPTHSDTPDPWGVYKPWVGWLEAIADLVDDLPDSEFAPWQLERLPEELRTLLIGGAISAPVSLPGEPTFTVTSDNGLRSRAFLMRAENMGQEGQRQGRFSDEPSTTVSGNPAYPRAFLIPGDNSGNGVIRLDNEPTNTIQTRPDTRCPHRALLVGDNYGSPNDTGEERILQLYAPDEPAMTVRSGVKTAQRAIVGGRVVKMTPRALARFMSLPDSYILPASNGLACEIIGNMVPALLAKAICESLI